MNILMCVSTRNQDKDLSPEELVRRIKELTSNIAEPNQVVQATTEGTGSQQHLSQSLDEMNGTPTDVGGGAVCI